MKAWPSCSVCVCVCVSNRYGYVTLPTLEGLTEAYEVYQEGMEQVCVCVCVCVRASMHAHTIPTPLPPAPLHTKLHTSRSIPSFPLRIADVRVCVCVCVCVLSQLSLMQAAGQSEKLSEMDINGVKVQVVDKVDLSHRTTPTTTTTSPSNTHQHPSPNSHPSTSTSPTHTHTNSQPEIQFRDARKGLSVAVHEGSVGVGGGHSVASEQVQTLLEGGTIDLSSAEELGALLEELGADVDADELMPQQGQDHTQGEVIDVEAQTVSPSGGVASQQQQQQQGAAAVAAGTVAGVGAGGDGQAAAPKPKVRQLRIKRKQR